MTHTKDEALKLALDWYDSGHEDREEFQAMIENLLAAPTVQEPVATVIEELEHDGEGFCAKVRWLYNPVPVGEMLSWEHPK
jgi:hypothetical protein